MKRKLFYLGTIFLMILVVTGCTINIGDDCKCEECPKCTTTEPTSNSNKDVVGKEFTRTYMIEHVAESNDYDYLYLTLRQIQSEEIETVKVKRNDFDNVQEEVYYEITFKIEKNEIEDNLKSIFENTTVVKAKKTNKTGLEQINEDF